MLSQSTKFEVPSCKFTPLKLCIWYIFSFFSFSRQMKHPLSWFFTSTHLLLYFSHLYPCFVSFCLNFSRSHHGFRNITSESLKSLKANGVCMCVCVCVCVLLLLCLGKLGTLQLLTFTYWKNSSAGNFILSAVWLSFSHSEEFTSSWVKHVPFDDIMPLWEVQFLVSNLKWKMW